MHKRDDYSIVKNGNVIYLFINTARKADPETYSYDPYSFMNTARKDTRKDTSKTAYPQADRTSLHSAARCEHRAGSGKETDRLLALGDYAGAAMLAERNGDCNLKESICESGISRYHKLLDNINTERSWTDTAKLEGRSVVYKKMADIFKAWNPGFQRLERIYRKLSSELLEKAHSLSLL